MEGLTGMEGAMPQAIHVTPEEGEAIARVGGGKGVEEWVFLVLLSST